MSLLTNSSADWPYLKLLMIVWVSNEQRMVICPTVPWGHAHMKENSLHSAFATKIPLLSSRWSASLGRNSLTPGRFEWNFDCNSQPNFGDWWLRYLLWNWPQMNVTGPYGWYANTSSGNGLLLDGTGPLPETMLTKSYVAIWCH